MFDLIAVLSKMLEFSSELKIDKRLIQVQNYLMVLVQIYLQENPIKFLEVIKV